VSIAVPPRHASAAAFGIGLAAAAAATAGAIALARGAARAPTTTLAAVTIVAGCTFVAGGIVGWLRRPSNRTGLLMTAAGFALLGSSLEQADQALPFTIGLVIGPLPAAILAHLILAFPDGRLHSRTERLVVGAAYLDATVVQVLMLMFMGFEHVNGCPCPSNLLFVRDRGQLHSALMAAQRYVGLALAVWIGVLLVRRWRAASAPMRRAVVPLFSAGSLTLALLAAAVLTTGTSPELSRAFSAAEQVALATVPLAFLLGLFNERLARVGVSDLIVELGGLSEPGKLRNALARALGDPSLELAYWIPESGSYVGIDGRPATVEASEGRTVTVLERGGRRVAALVHDPALGEQRELLDAVAAAAGLALENERLQAELRAQLEELRASRMRIVEAGDNERRRLERNLHDGAQQRLVALSVALGLAHSKLERDPETAAGLLASAREELKTGLSELRELARGLHPAIRGRGLEVALAGLAERSPVPVDVVFEQGEGPGETVEAAAYYVVSEALTNVARYAKAERARVHVASVSDGLRIDVVDDGIGGANLRAGSGLQGLRDRVEAIGGRLELESPPGGGTRVTAFLPTYGSP
jgi:signal transduction histidine kinase